MEKQRLTFLSYSRANKDFALRLAKELKSEGFHIWLDLLDIPPGARWDVEVEKALVESEIFMIIITKASISSDNVLDEIGYAIDNGKRFLPVLLEKCNVPLRLRRFQYVDFTDKNFDEGVQSAKGLLRDLMAQPTVLRNELAKEKEDREESEGSRDEKQIGMGGIPAEQKNKEAEQETFITTGHLITEERKQDSSLNAEDARIKKEMAELQTRLENERIALEKLEALQRSKEKSQHAPLTARSKLAGIFGISLLAIVVAGYSLLKLVPGFGGVHLTTETPAPTKAMVTQTSIAPFLSETANVPVIPFTEVPPATEVRPATEVSTDTAIPTEGVTAGAPLPEITDEAGAQMVLVPEGDFMMGSSRGKPDEQPVHTVFLDAFYMDKFEVTNKLYKACVDVGKCDPPRQTYFFSESPNKAYYDNLQYDNYPVIYVDWNMAETFCQWRGARLPSEAEWEKAARGTEGNIYPWGRDLNCQRANYQNCVNRTSEVGNYEDGASPYGVYDMTGNVWEWVADWYSNSYYTTSPLKNPHGPITGQARVLRGGGWPRYDVTAFHRNRFAPDYYTFDIGFRCARNINR